MTDPASAPFVRVVVLNWNAAWLTTRCVRSLQSTDYPADRYEIVVVDNASIDGSLPRLEEDLTGVRFVANDRNYGFAEGNNRALRDLEGCDHVALINNDAVVDPGWLTPLVEALAHDDRLGAAAPKMLLEASFAAVEVTGDRTIAAVEADGVDVTRRCIYDGVTERAHDTVPLAIERTVSGSATIHVPVTASPRSGRGTEIRVRWTDGPDHIATSGASGTTRRINSLGTGLKPWTEGFERWFGAIDRPHLDVHETWGFSGGGVLLRSSMLADVGVFDPRFFAYYEDTDLAWRARRRGWRVACVPASVVHHLHGGSAGPEAQGFFFLNYRNWLLTVLRNGSVTQLITAFALARRLSWPAFRRNVFGAVRRGRRPDLRITGAWARVAAGVALGAPAVVGQRLTGRRVGTSPGEHVASRLMPSTPPRSPRPRPGGPVLCYVDVTETLRSGWRAGIQRVVCELVRTLPPANHDIELVLVCWSKVHDRFRRVDTAEYARLLAPTAAQQPAGAPPPPSAARRLLAKLMHGSGVAPIVYRRRRRRELAAVPAHHRDLLLDRFEPGSIFFDVDASWNPTTQERSILLPQLVAGGVGTAMFLHDLLPQTHPHWFIPQLAEVSTAHVQAHLDAGSLFVCNSSATAAALAAYAEGRSVESVVVPMGVFATDTAVHSDAPADADPPMFLVVGTVEPRKNHLTILDAFAKVRAAHPTARLVVVGRAGWNSEHIESRLRDAATSGVDWRTDTSDDDLAALYRAAHAVVVASFTEGFGLPVVEGLRHGAVVLSSNGGALPEAGGDLVEYFEPESVDALAGLMARHLSDDEHHRSRRAVAAGYVPSSWSVSARRIGDELLTLAGRERRT